MQQFRFPIAQLFLYCKPRPYNSDPSSLLDNSMAESAPATPVETGNIVSQLQKSSFGWFVNALSAMEDVVPPGSFSLPRVVVRRSFVGPLWPGAAASFSV